MRLIGGSWRDPAARLALVLAAMACGSGKDDSKPRASAAVESTTTADTAATEPTNRSRILFLGTSLTAGLGLEPDSAYPAVIQRLAAKDGYAVDIINAGLSGETSAGALRRADWLMSQPLEVIVIETGANDGLRGLDPDSTAANITALIGKVRAAQPRAAVMLAQMEAPTNLGPAFQRRFRAVFPGVARATGVRLLPFLLDGVGGRPELNQDDGIHPTAEGARKVAANVYRGLRPVLDSMRK
ncbi:MAG: arylesterase [Gemmatimonadaceae bacterium]